MSKLPSIHNFQHKSYLSKIRKEIKMPHILQSVDNFFLSSSDMTVIFLNIRIS